MSIGHYLANVGVRCALESKPVRERIPAMAKEAARMLSAVSTPGSEDQKAWIFHSKSRLVLEAIGGRSKAIRPLRVAAGLNDAASWKPMVDLRGTFFHRVREEFPAAPEASVAAVERLLEVNVTALRCLGRAIPAFRPGPTGGEPASRPRPNSGNPATGAGVHLERQEEMRLTIPTTARFRG